MPLSSSYKTATTNIHEVVRNKCRPQTLINLVRTRFTAENLFVYIYASVYSFSSPRRLSVLAIRTYGSSSLTRFRPLPVVGNWKRCTGVIMILSVVTTPMCRSGTRNDWNLYKLISGRYVYVWKKSAKTIWSRPLFVRLKQFYNGKYLILLDSYYRHVMCGAIMERTRKVFPIILSASFITCVFSDNNGLLY